VSARRVRSAYRGIIGAYAVMISAIVVMIVAAATDNHALFQGAGYCICAAIVVLCVSMLVLIWTDRGERIP
jgi:uncharacterized membrane protein YvlD (DUF360 family)